MMENVSAPTRALLAPFGDLLAPLQPHDGYCDLQKSSAREDFYSFYDEKAHPCDNSHEHNGHWTLKGRSGVAGLQHCLARCVECERCHFISHMMSADLPGGGALCTWFHSCSRTSNVHRRLRGAVTYRVRRRKCRVAGCNATAAADSDHLHDQLLVTPSLLIAMQSASAQSAATALLHAFANDFTRIGGAKQPTWAAVRLNTSTLHSTDFNAARSTDARSNERIRSNEPRSNEPRSNEPRSSAPSSNELSSVEFVPAVYKEWGHFNARQFPAIDGVTPGGFASPPAFVPALLPNVSLYQRLSPSQPRFVSNKGLEMGIFLHHIATRYDYLADITVFAQADLKPTEALGLHCLRPNATWAPVSSSADPRYFQRGGCASFWHQHPERRACFERYIAIFGLQWPDVTPDAASAAASCPSFYIQNAFVVSSARIRRFPRDVWRRAYERALNSTSECITDGTGGERSTHAGARRPYGAAS